MERIAAATCTRMAKRLLALVGALAVMLAVAIPALAQEEQGSAAGVLRDGLPADVGGSGTHSITDETSGTLYALESEGVNLDAYVGQQVTVYGTLTPSEAGSGNPGFEGNGTLPSIDVARVEPADGPPAGPAPGEAATLTFELSVEGEPSEGTQFFGAPGEGGGQFFDAEGNTLGPVPLTDPDGDGLFTGSTTLVNPGTGPVVSLPVQIVQENGGNIEVIRDFGVVPVDGDETFSASVSFNEDGEGLITPGVPSPQDRTATFDFQLTVKGEPPADARFFGAVPAEGCISVPLTDPDGDGVFTGSLDVPRFPPGPVPPDAEPVSLPVQIVQADAGASPCDPTGIIKDFDAVPADDDTFKARVNFKEGRGGDTTTPEPGNSGGSDDSDDPGNSGSSDSGSSDSGSSDSGSSDSGSSDSGSSDSGSSDSGSSGSGSSGSSGSGSSGSGSSGSGSSGSGSGDSGGSGSGGSDNAAESSGSPSGVTSGIRGMLPSTGGGVALWVLGAGILLIGGGLLVRKLAR